jgi:hypothetical protein
MQTKILNFAFPNRVIENESFIEPVADFVVTLFDDSELLSLDFFLST